MQVPALADTSAHFLCLPEEIQIELQLEKQAEREMTIADGTRRLCPYVGPVKVEFENRVGYVGALILGTEVLLGAIPMEDMDLVVIPLHRQVRVNPLHPNFAGGLAK